MTVARRAILELFFMAKKPIGVQNILAGAEKEGVTMNKTTAYREIQRLLEDEIILEVRLPNEREKRYELTLHDHHHHVQCLRCGKVIDVAPKETLNKTVKEIERRTGFTIVDHAIEFSGVCPDCHS